MVNVAILGAGRIAEVHARGVALAGGQLAGVYDIRKDAATKLASRFSTRVFESVEEILSDRSIEVVAIATSTDTHADYIVAAAKAGKAIFCEKPIDLSVARAEQCREQIEGTNAFIQIGFNRRFDSTFARVAAAVREEKIGRLENLTIISRDPAPASIDYLKVSGGLFKDMAIHDFDMARFILPEEPVEVFAVGSVLVSKEIGSIADIDSATVVLKTRSGIQCQILNSRRAVYGYDQRIEAFGSEGALLADNPRIDETRSYTRDATDSRARLPDFFLERYTASYNLEWEAFFKCLSSNTPPKVTFADGLRALKIAEAANKSLGSGRTIPIT
jgi:myo-inositol 2-dehydrogenase/D-chiro-inositol 1-dehydrogenase